MAAASSAPGLRIGYVPLVDAAPLVVADALGLFAAAGVRVALSPERAWAAVRDKLAFGALDGAHLLAPMAVALAAGAGGLRRRLDVTLRLGRNGNAIVLSRALAEAIGPFAPPLTATAFARALMLRAEEGLPPPTLAAVFPHSSHNYLLREWLAGGGLDPDHDTRLVVVPPPQTARALAEGAIEGFCAGEPWGSHAAAIGAGRVTLTSGDIWPDHPEKVLAFREGLPHAEAVALTAAVIAAARWLDDPANNEAAAELMHARVFPALSPETVRLAFEGRVAAQGSDGGARVLPAPLRFRPATFARPEAASWWLRQMRRWSHLPASVPDAEALSPYGDAIWRAAASLVGESEPDPVTLPEEIAA
jgi:two-component system, oxyanion-binding sensor